MTNEWAEFRAYSEQPVYAAEGKKDTRYLGRFTYKTLMGFEGLGRILTIIARGYLFHDRDAIKKSAEKIRTMGDRTIYYGHGKPTKNGNC